MQRDREPANPANKWEECPPGLLVGVGRQLSRRMWARATMAAAAAAILAGGFRWLAERSNGSVSEHEQVAALLPRYVAGRLAVPEQRLVERHLASCPACQEALRSLRGESTSPA
ncbi:MAG: zf-HC2 domain-containing protein [Planctomycetota bacterium]|nr:MAG: zf-HC2 domain-containing protein [Planctomycetota bacterium]